MFQRCFMALRRRYQVWLPCCHQPHPQSCMVMMATLWVECLVEEYLWTASWLVFILEVFPTITPLSTCSIQWTRLYLKTVSLQFFIDQMKINEFYDILLYLSCGSSSDSELIILRQGNKQSTKNNMHSIFFLLFLFVFFLMSVILLASWLWCGWCCSLSPTQDDPTQYRSVGSFAKRDAMVGTSTAPPSLCWPSWMVLACLVVCFIIGVIYWQAVVNIVINKHY